MAKLLNSTSIIAVVLAARGGVGKSVIAAVLREALAGPDGSNKVQVLESDLNNSSMASIDKNALRVDLSGDKTGMGNAFLAVKRLVNDEAQAVVWDTPAGNEKLVVDLLRMVVAKLKKDMPAARVVVFRPITTSVFTQEFAVEFCKTARELGIAVVMVRNLGQGRLPEYYNDWDANSERAAAIKGGAEEIILPDLGAWVADESTALGLSFGDLALGKFEKAGEKARKAAEAKFDEGKRLWILAWLEQRVEDFTAAMARAIANTDAIAKGAKQRAE